MTNRTDELSQVRERLPYTDRRTLSQAWYDALHLAPARGRVASRDDGDFTQQQHDEGAIPRRATGDRRLRLSGTASVAVGIRKGEPRVPLAPDDAARSAHRRLSVELRASRSWRLPVDRRRFELTIGDASVQLFVRTSGGTLDVIAVCRAQDREPVRRALVRAVADARQHGRLVSVVLHVERRTERTSC